MAVLLLTGAPGVGKTTVVRAVTGALSGRRLAGFFTDEVRAGRERRGFAFVTLEGRRARMADVSRPGAPRVGKYGVDVEVIDALSRSAVVATIAVRGGGFIEEVKRRPGAVVWEVTRANRDAMPERVVAWVEPHLRRRAP